ncbi:Ubiquitinyl hydrolase 1 protein [Dioscorea alata]|uniref:Ubiquitinyl hydrolase 1 protein n=1 Tax=Dioscorea alata TaxID=55571 RepID=A0ACB7VPK7_DIOAL|nr:Ubiquitinyl hydrolase 1 protein [Dioscorea alata]
MGNSRSNLKRSAVQPEKKMKEPNKSLQTPPKISNFNFVWKIQKFSLLPSDKGFKCESGDFYAFDSWWKLQLVKEGNQYLGLHLCMQCSPSYFKFLDFNVKFKLSVLDQMGENHWTVEANNAVLSIWKKWGFSKFIELEELYGVDNCYVMDDTCVFELEIFSFTPIMKKIETLAVQVYEPQTHKWIIPNFSELPKMGPVTESFTMFDFLWKLELYPNGRSESHRNVSLSLFYESSKPHPSAEFTLSIIDQIKGEHKKMTASAVFGLVGQNWAFPNFLALKDLHEPSKGYIVNDICQVEVEIKILGFVNS